MYRGTSVDRSEGGGVVQGAESESRDKLRSLPNALHNSGCRFNFLGGKPSLCNSVVCGLRERLLVQFANDVNTFSGQHRKVSSTCSSLHATGRPDLRGHAVAVRFEGFHVRIVRLQSEGVRLLVAA